MAHSLSQVPRQILSQQQRLTPQLIQAMDILQLNAMALESRIATELDGNPALEVAPADDEGSVAADAPPAAAETERTEGEQTLVVSEGDGQDFERLDNLNQEYDFFEEDSDYRGTKSRAALSEEGDFKLDAMANTAARPMGLRESLLEQWTLLELDGETRRLGVAIIDNLKENGRCETPLEEIAAALSPAPSIARLEDALARIQQLDPAGVAARNPQECLLLQLEAAPGDTEIARTIIESHFDDLQRNRIPHIAKSLGVEIEDIKDALTQISRMSLHPGAEADVRDSAVIMPDIIVEFREDEDRYDVRLTRGNTRELRISEEFREALESARNDKTARDFMKQKIDAAAAIIDAVRFRRDRLLEVARAVVEAQRDFLDHGEQHIKVLRMSDLAEQFGCDPSTISRTVDEKWMQTPRGIYPLRRFFTGGTELASGEILGWDSIKAKVQEIVSNENKREPLDDDQIVEALAKQGIEIKRRTVAKYRAQLEIPTARQRKQY